MLDKGTWIYNTFYWLIKEFKDWNLQGKWRLYFDLEIIAIEFMASEDSEYHLILMMEHTCVLVLTCN